MQNQIGCFNRPWNQWDYEIALKGIQAAGYEHTGLMYQRGKLLLSTDSSPDEILEMKDLIESHELRPAVVLGGPPLDLPVQQAAEQFCRLIDNVHLLGADYVLTCGTMNEEEYETYYQVMAQCCDYAAQQQVMLTLKPHGGIGATARECLTAIERIDHPNFAIYYDPGNVHYYTGEDAAQDIKLIANYVVGICVKDCTGFEDEVMITIGEGLVDFESVFGTLKDAGFTGPVTVECFGGETPEQINVAAQQTYEFVARLLS